MAKIRIVILALIMTTVGIEAKDGDGADQVYRLPVYPLRQTSMTVDCFIVSTDPPYSEMEDPLNVLQFLLGEIQGESTFETSGNFKLLSYFTESLSLAFTKAVAYSRVHQMYSEFMYWLDNVHAFSQSLLNRVEYQFFQFDGYAFDKIFLEASFISIYHGSQSNEADLESLSSFLKTFPGVLYISWKNDTIMNLDHFTLQTLQSERIASIFNLFKDSLQIANLDPSVEDYMVDLPGLLLEVEEIFAGGEQSEYPPNPPYSLERNLESSGFTICSVESPWELPKLIETVLSHTSDTLHKSVVNLSSLVKYELEKRLVADGKKEQCMEVNCWRRDASTLLALPAPNVEEGISETCFSVYFAVGTLTPNLRIGAPTWINGYLEEAGHNETANNNGYKKVYTLRNLHHAYERALNFVTFIYNLKEYAEDILAEASLRPQTKIPLKSFYRDFTEMGYYVLQRNYLQFPNEILNQLVIDLFHTYVNISFSGIIDDPVGSQFQGSVNVDSISFNLLTKIDRLMNEHLNTLGTEVKLIEVSTNNYPEFLIVYNKVKEVSESLENYDEVFRIKKDTFENNDIHKICEGSRRRFSSDFDTNIEAALQDYSVQLRNAALNISKTMASNIRNILRRKYTSRQCSGLIWDNISSSFLPVFEPLTMITSQPCVSPKFVGWLKEPAFLGYIPTSVLDLLTPLTHKETPFLFGSTVSNPLEILKEKQVQLLKVNVYQMVFSQLGQYSMWLDNIKSKAASSSDEAHFKEVLGMAVFQKLNQFREIFLHIQYQGIVLLENDWKDETEIGHDELLLKIGIQLFQDLFVPDENKVVSLNETTDFWERYRLSIHEIFSVKEGAIEMNDSTVIGNLVKNVTVKLDDKLEGSSVYRLVNGVYDFQEYMDNGVYEVSVCASNVSSFNERRRNFVDRIDEHLRHFSEALGDLAVELYWKVVVEEITVSQSRGTSTRMPSIHDEVKKVTESGEKDNENQPESTPEDNKQEQYRAFFVSSQDGTFPITGNRTEFQVAINALESRFEGVQSDDVKINMHDLKNFRNETTIIMTVVSVTAASITVGVSADSSATWSFTMTIKGQPILNGQSADSLKVDLKVIHQAPKCLVHRFTDSGNAIRFEFDVYIQATRRREGGCGYFFQDASNLGNGAICDIKTPWLLEVTIGKGTNLIEPGEVLVFKSNAVYPARQLYYHSLTTEGFSIDPPNNPQRLSFTIDGPARINRCGTYQLKAEQITGHGGRPLTYQWQPYTTDESGARQDRLTEARDTAVLQINASDLTPGEEYAYSLEITNFLGQTSTEYHALIVSDNVSPVVQIKPINVIPNRVRASSRVKLEAVITYSFGDDCLSNQSSSTYDWSDSQGLIPAEIKDDRILVLPPNTLPVGENIQFTVNAVSTLQSGSLLIVDPVTVSDSITLTTIPSRLVAEIVGASKLTLGPEETIELDESPSNDPDDSGSEDLNFQWSCLSTSDKESCNDRVGNQLTTPKLTLQASLFQVGSYSVTLTVSKGSRRATASVKIIIVEDSVPMVKLKTRKRKIKFRDGESIYIQANIASSSAVNVVWRELNDRLDSELWEKAKLKKVPNKAVYITHVIIPADITVPGSEYTIEVIVTDQIGKIGVAALGIEIYQTITQCEVYATPYTEMQEMTLTATGCVTDPDSEPLTYQPFFGFPDEDGYKTIILDSSKGESSQTVIATPIDYNNENMLVGFKVCDASLTCIDALTTTPYQSTAVLSDAERDKFIAEKIDNELEKGNMAKAFTNAINIANMQKKSLTVQARRKKRNVAEDYEFLFTDDLNSVLIVVTQLDLSQSITARKQFNELGRKQAMVLSKVKPVDSNEGAVILDLSSQMVQSTFNEEEIDTTLSAIDRIFRKAKEEGVRHNSETIERALTTLGSSARNLKDTSSDEKRITQRKKISDLRKTVLTQAGHHLSIGDHVTLNISGSTMSIICTLPEADGPIAENAGLPVNILLSESLSQRYTYDWCASREEACSGVKALVMQVEDLGDDTLKCSDLTDVTLLNPLTDEKQLVQNLEEPIEIQMTTMGVHCSQTCVCKYWNEETSQLETTGVTSETTADGKLICRSGHLTTFVGELVIYSNSSADPTTNQGLPTTSNHLVLILGVVFGVFLVTLMVIFVGTVIFKLNQKKKKVSPEGE